MNTFILFWNPDVSSYTLERMRDDLEHWAHVSNWSVWQHDLAHKGDRFFMVRCGQGKTGICMSGRFRSEPYRAEDWSGKGREVYYMDLLADTVIAPDYLPILPTEELSTAIPTFDWTGGHSGRLLPAGEAEKLEKIWAAFLEQNKWIFSQLTLKNNCDDLPRKEACCDEDVSNYGISNKKLGIAYYKQGLQLLRKYQYDRAYGYFLVAYDVLQNYKDLDCYPDLCYRLELGMPLFAPLDRKLSLLEEALEGFKRQASMGKSLLVKKVKSIKNSIEFMRYEQKERSCRDVVSPDAVPFVKGLELIDNYLGSDYTQTSQFHDAEIVELKWSFREVVLKLNIYDECIATFRFMDVVNLDTDLETDFIYEMKFHIYNQFVECWLDGITITCKEVICESVEKYEDYIKNKQSNL